MRRVPGNLSADARMPPSLRRMSATASLRTSKMREETDQEGVRGRSPGLQVRCAAPMPRLLQPRIDRLSSHRAHPSAGPHGFSHAAGAANARASLKESKGSRAAARPRWGGIGWSGVTVRRGLSRFSRRKRRCLGKSLDCRENGTVPFCAHVGVTVVLPPRGDSTALAPQQSNVQGQLRGRENLAGLHRMARVLFLRWGASCKKPIREVEYLWRVGAALSGRPMVGSPIEGTACAPENGRMETCGPY